MTQIVFPVSLVIDILKPSYSFACALGEGNHDRSTPFACSAETQQHANICKFNLQENMSSQ